MFSNAVLHWCKKNPGGVLESVKKVLKPGGRFVAEFGGRTNCIGIHNPQLRRCPGSDPGPAAVYQE